MDTQTQTKSREKDADKPQEGNLKQDGKEGTEEKQQAALPTSPASPSSASSSPSHEFSFTISLHSASAPVPDKAKNPPNSFAIDLSPADDIFFHGHLLPLHLLSHLPVSPRSSFSLFGWRKGCEVKEKEEDKGEHKKKLRFDASQVLKRYARMVRPLMFFKGRRENLQSHRQPYSFSGNLSLGNKQELRGRGGECSAPASMRTSPTNSGLLLATASLPSSTSNSTMEEFHAAIQAAIAHCKNSIAAEEKMKC
ncbi:BRI1 kinase inhibitor 1-like [Populus alba x Populus x berolinensis]|nr:BRI1 kinase inhibitor 1-like [Populus alba x Populus x berolinensis]